MWTHAQKVLHGMYEMDDPSIGNVDFESTDIVRECPTTGCRPQQRRSECPMSHAATPATAQKPCPNTVAGFIIRDRRRPQMAPGFLLPQPSSKLPSIHDGLGTNTLGPRSRHRAVGARASGGGPGHGAHPRDQRRADFLMIAMHVSVRLRSINPRAQHCQTCC